MREECVRAKTCFTDTEMRRAEEWYSAIKTGEFINKFINKECR